MKDVIEPITNIRNYCNSENYKKQVNRVKRVVKPVLKILAELLYWRT